MKAPTMAAMKPAPSPVRYQPIAWPSQPATTAPAIPSRTVMMHPPGSRPGISSLAMAPAKPPITIRCECGETKDVAYGERWQCETCGRSWNTQQIPAEDYEDLLRRVRRHKLEVLAAVVISAAIFVPLIVFVSGRFLAVVPVAMALWLFLFLPAWRRRYTATARAAPRWELHPE